MRSTTTYSALLGLFGTLSVLGAPAPIPQSASASSATSSVSGGGGSSGFSYTCSGDKDWTDASGNAYKCQGDTVCKEGAAGGPCVWPEGYGAGSVALVQTDAALGGVSTSVPAGGSVSSAIPTLPSNSATLGDSVQSSVAASATTATGAAVGTASSAVGGSGASSVVGSATSATSASVLSSSTASGNTTNSSSSTTSSSSSSSGGTRFVGYWENYSNLGGVEAAQMDGITHVILSFIDMNSWSASSASFAESSNGNFDATTADTLRGMNSGVKVTAALGGWGLDEPIKTAADGGEAAIKTFVQNAQSVVKLLNLDGLDLDWEFPTAAQQPAFVSMVKQLKAAIQEVNSDGILSVAIGSRTTQKSPTTGATDVDAMTSDTFSELNDVVDMWNVMTYDFVNRYDTKTGHQSGGKVVEDTLKFYEGVGIDLQKVNIGFLNTAKYFTLTESCSAAEPIGCPMGGVDFFETGDKDNGKSGWLRYNAELDQGLGEYAAINAEMRSESWAKKPDDSQTAFEAEKAHAWYDEDKKVFWTWTSADDNKAVCEEYKSKVGGMFVWSMNQDENGKAGGSHMKALAECVKG
ncbi:hypothetical protein L486_02324 [Kwoniella mangroviensis CBS 10435]|uniref:GH18 domain-containing protein n=1 Tax=Kwoniella mangroviensis CBS 10435 TaxID=1331196 RepID=A0A1B9IVU3_9TREE|nr:hypothetical protein L486_02324 [Kwoniella mangroviensis CBS 10435]